MPSPSNERKSRSEVEGIVRQLQVIGPAALDLATSSELDTGNSTTTVLDPGGTNVFTGTSIDVSNYAAATVHVYTDQDSASGGLELQTSSDGTNWDHVHAYDVAANVSRHIDRTLDAQHFRVKYTNGVTLQGFFRLQVKLHKHPPAMHAHQLSDTFVATHGANTVRSVLAGFDAVAGASSLVNSYDMTSGDVGLLVMPADAAGTPIEIQASGSDALTNDTNGLGSLSMLYGYNGSDWDRLRSSIANGLEVDVTRVQGSFGGVQTENTIDETAFDLGAAPFSEVSVVSGDYILDSIKLNFDTTTSKTITVTGPEGTVLYEDTNTAQSVLLTDINMGFDDGDQFTVAVTQTAATTMDCVAVVRKAAAALVGDPEVTIQAVADNFEVFEATLTVTAALDLNAVLARNATDVTIWNDDAGNSFTVEMSTTSAPAYGGAHTVRPGESLVLSDISIHTIRLGWTADAAYRVLYI